MTLTDAVASRLAKGTYRYRNEQWQFAADGDAWSFVSTPLDGYSYEEGVAVIAACNWATLEEA